MIPEKVQKLIDSEKYAEVLSLINNVEHPSQIDEIFDALIEKDYFPASEMKWTLECLEKIRLNKGDGGKITIDNYLRKHPDSVDALYAKGKYLSITHRESESIKYYDMAINDFDNKDPLSNLKLDQIIFDKITSLINSGKSDAGLDMIKELEEKNEKNTSILNLKSLAYLKLENYETSIYYANESLNIKETAEAYYYKANSYYYLKNYRESFTTFIYSKRNRTSETPLDMLLDGIYKTGLSLMELEKYQDAVKYFNETIKFERFNLEGENLEKIKDAEAKKEKLITLYNVENKELRRLPPISIFIFIISVIVFIILQIINNQLKYIFLAVIILLIIRYVYKVLTW